MIVRLDLVEARLRAPFVSARGTKRSVPLMRLSLEDAAGLIGHGEAVGLEAGVDQIRAGLESCRPLLAGSDGEDRERLLARCAGEAIVPEALAAIDMALWDLAARRERQPLWRLLGESSAPAVEVNATVASEDRASAVSAAAAARAAGFRCLKVKVGLGDDAGRLTAVREVAGPRMAIRLDANGVWSVDEAVAALRRLEPVGIELCEEPCTEVGETASVAAAVTMPIALDQSSSEPGALERRVCAAVCLKVARCGGISGVIDAAERARRSGYRVYLASTLDGPLGIAAALHTAGAIRPDYACGLATLSLFDGRADPLPGAGGRLVAPGGPGLGAGLLGWYSG